MDPKKTFVFDRYEIDSLEKKVHFYYEVREQESVLHTFCETFQLPDNFSFQRMELIDRICSDLHLIVGISYFKAFVPGKIEIKSREISSGQAQFWNTIYSIGLGEFYYKNKIDFRDKVHFPHIEGAEVEPIIVDSRKRFLVPDGGGKDSIVTFELIKKLTNDLDLSALSPVPLQYQVAEEAGLKLIACTRVVDQKLIELSNKGEVLNGHVPISLVYAFTHLLLAAGLDYSHVVFSNERSSDYGNVEYLGLTINHQWSKSYECEKMLSNYIDSYITPSIKIFSLLRPWYEIKIAEKFSHMTTYHHLFSSCNRNFSLSKQGESTGSGLLWCGECPKCAFVFCMLAAFIDKEHIIKIFGTNLYQSEKLLQTYRELLGLGETKPFECVGTPDEVKVALCDAYSKGEYKGDLIMNMFETEALPAITDSIEELRKRVFSNGITDNIPNELRIKNEE